ncbi:sulfite exporter TauE/SafE family protein [Granulicella tundricola]|uniref:Probable membrane transporter protein n=1 Tax=Granulicella tundricola (strain ATCC BAA-1859 / DSM 23138 / MP5ACTX9) TaxID=1198114 RepID=E8X6Q9_GRATM|nr:sulfite exporter TauE/SafE family protein [Granulicella tundricola]ADW71209.1 protein of unknown function DUF81 [Granulicella tundricola MP5ACTX9]
MTLFVFTGIVLLSSIGAGLVGALTGLGGGIVVTPVLTLMLGVDIGYAIGASLISVIATSSGAAAAYVRDGLSNVRVGIFLEVATTLGAISGALISGKIPTTYLAILFGLVLLHSAWQASQARVEGGVVADQGSLSRRLRLGGTYRAEGKEVEYVVSREGTGLSLMYVAGMLSGLLGIGSGALKVIAMDRVMGLPFKVSTATSSFMIGVTAVASATIYFKRGYILPQMAVPVMIGVLIGSMVGARLLPRLPVKTLRRIFAIVVGMIAIQMIVKGVRGTL